MAKRARKNRVLGLDLGSYAVKAVEMTRAGERLFVSGYAYEPVDDPGKYADAVGKAVQSGRLAAERVVVGVSGKTALARQISVPAGGEDDLARSFLLAAEKTSGLMLAGSLHGHQILGQGGSAMVDGVFCSVRPEEVEARLDALRAAGIAPERVDLELVALANAYETANSGGFYQESRRPALLADLGASKSLAVALGGGMHHFRELPGGGNELTEMLARRMDLGLDAAERVKCDPGGVMEIVKDVMYPALENLAAGLRAVVDGFRRMGGAEPGLLLLSGGLSIFPGVAKVLGRLVGVESRVFNSFGAVPADQYDRDFLLAYAHEFPLAFGLASHARN